jgi:hypothetical protein
MGWPEIAQSWELLAVLIARYFVVVGSGLVALLFIAAGSLPKPPRRFADRPEIIERAAIRITSQHKWPEKVVLDTNQPTFSPLPIGMAPAQQSFEALPDDMVDQTSVDVQTKSNSDTRPIDAHRRLTRAEPKPARASRSTHVARTRNRNEQPTIDMRVECCLSEWADGPAVSKAESRKRVARRDSWIGWHFPEIN